MEAHSLAGIFPMMDEHSDEWSAFVSDIRANGLNHPIIRYQGKILDGRNRLRACKEAGIEPWIVDYEKTDHAKKSPIVFVWSENVHRRHLNASQRALATARRDDLMSEFASQAKAAHAAGVSKGAESANAKNNNSVDRSLATLPKTAPFQTHRLAAAAAQVAPRTMQAAITLRKAEADNKVIPQVVAAVESGRLSVDAAASLSRAPKAEQREVLASVTKSLKGDAAEIRGSKVKQILKQNEIRKRKEDDAKVLPNRATVKHCTAMDLLGAVEPFDLLLTDPPYSTDVDDIEAFAREWLPAALKKLKPTGRAYICIGAYPLELLAYLTVLRETGWIDRSQVLVWTYRNTIGPSPTHDYKLNWQAILYLRGVDASRLDCPVMVEQFSVQDINAPDGRQGDRYHAWQKPDELATRLVRHSSREGDVVVDPFACTGTFLLAASRAGRKSLGCDISRENLEIAIKRGCVLDA